MTPRPTCSTKGCSAPARGKNGECKRCYQRRWFSMNKGRLLAERKRIRRSVRRTDGPRVTARFDALQALSAAQVTERRGTALMWQLGLNAPHLPRDAPSVQILLDELQGPIARQHVIDTDYIRHFGGVFFGMDETYLEAVGLLLKSKEPWRPFCLFANRLMNMIQREGAEALARSDDFRLAVSYVTTARAHLWNISYMLCQRMHGPRIAEDVLGEKPSPVDELAALLS